MHPLKLITPSTWFIIYGIKGKIGIFSGPTLTNKKKKLSPCNLKIKFKYKLKVFYGNV